MCQLRWECTTFTGNIQPTQFPQIPLSLDLDDEPKHRPLDRSNWPENRDHLQLGLRFRTSFVLFSPIHFPDTDNICQYLMNRHLCTHCTVSFTYCEHAMRRRTTCMNINTWTVPSPLPCSRLTCLLVFFEPKLSEFLRAGFIEDPPGSGAIQENGRQ